MKASILFNNEPKDFNSIKELKTFLNSAFYYANDLILFNHTANVEETYKNINNIAYLVSECNFYNVQLEVIQIFE